MSLPRILLVGRQGQVGWELCRTLAPVGRLTAVDYPEINLADADSIRTWIRDTAPNVVVNAAAYTAVDKAESEPALCDAINATAPGLLAEESKRQGALFVHYSTDYVYDGAKQAPYTENDPPNPVSAYGRSKCAGDQAVQAVDGIFLIFRLCWVYGARGQNFLRTIQRLARERETLRVVDDQRGCPTWSRMIAEATALALHRVLSAADPTAYRGVYHLAASGETSWHGFAERIVALMPPAERRCRQVEAISTGEYPTPARRPAYSVLNCDKLRDRFAIRLPDWEQSLELLSGQTG